jgi:c-di-GMP-binding flagellar brake protein YcgR
MTDSVQGTARAQVPVRLVDLSRGGALFAMGSALDVGSIHDFTLDLSGEALWVQGEVRRCRAARSGDGYEVAVEFVGIDPHDLRRLVEYLSRRG